MFQRFASALFGDDVDKLSSCSRPGDGSKQEEEEDEDWILVNYLAETCSSQRGDGLSKSTVVPDDEDEDLVMIPSPIASPPIRYASSISLNSTADTDLDGGPEEDEEDEDEEEDMEEGSFLRLDASSLEESWFVTPPPCFMGRGSQPVLLETSPLENLLIEHPSMSVYAHHSPSRLPLDPLPRSLDLEHGLFSSSGSVASAASGGKEKARCSPEAPHHRSDVSVVQHPSSIHTAFYTTALSTNTGLLQPRSGRGAQHVQPLSRNALRRLNLLRLPKPGAIHLHQPSQRHVNF